MKTNVKQGLKAQLLNYLKDNGTITRKEAYQWSKAHHYEQATFERRARELVNEIGVIPLNEEGKRASVGQSEHIVAWRWKSMTSFKNK